MTADAGIGPKYRPSRESADCQFIRKSSPWAMTRHPCPPATEGRLREASNSRRGRLGPVLAKPDAPIVSNH
jgi:hypothetical protein